MSSDDPHTEVVLLTASSRRTPPALNAKILQLDPLTQWWTTEDNSLCVALRSVSHSPVLAVGGVLDQRGAAPCRRALEVALRARPRRMVLDLSAVTATDLPAVGLVDAMRRAAAWHGAEIWLASLPDSLRVGLQRAGVLTEFPVARTMARAIEEMRRLERPFARTA